MPPVIDATVGGASANSYELQSEADVYFASRIPIVPPWPVSPSATAIPALITGTRTLDALAQPFKTFFPAGNGVAYPYYRVRRMWTGAPATSTQRLAWPRIGMFDHNNNAIDPTTIPQALKDALAEFAGQLLKTDRTLDNDVIVQGITAVRAGSVSVNFKQEIMPQVIPDAVFDLMPTSWLTDELYVPANPAEFDVVSRGGSEMEEFGRRWWEGGY